MANTKISNLTEDTAPTGGNYFVEVDDTGGTPVTKRVNGSHLVEMGERNYKFVVTIVTNTLVVSLKNLSGNDFSAVDPLVVKIGNAWYTITTALSVGVAAGGNYFNAGSAEWATKAIDYFLYFSYRAASSTVVLGLSRIPWANLYSDFSATSTSEKFGLFSTTPAATDDCVNAGRIRATLSAGAGYTWTSASQSAPTSENTVNRPIFETSQLSWVPQFTNLTVGNGTLTATCVMFPGNVIEYHVELVLGSTSSVGGDVVHTLPFTRGTYGGTRGVIGGTLRLISGGAAYVGSTQFNSTTVVAFKVLNASTTYVTQTSFSSIIPGTWTTADEIYEWVRYFAA